MEEIQSKIKKIEESIEKIESEKDDAQTKIKSLEKSLGAENLDKETRALLQARLAPLDAQLAELQKRLAGYEQDRRESTNKPLQTASGAFGDSFVSDLINKRFRGMFKDIGEDLLENETTFFNALFQSPETTDGTLVRFCENDKAFEIPLGLHPIVSGLYVRKFYSALFNKLSMTKNSFQVVTGNPGIGKTFFGFYVVRRFIQQRRAVLYEPNQPGRIEVTKPYYIYKIMPNDGDPGVTIKKYDRTDFFKNVKKANINSNFIHIVDGHEPLRFGNVPIILITSNRRMNLEEFKKGSFTQWFMPLWSLEELLAYRTCFHPDISEAIVNLLFEHWNGLIRYVISKPVDYIAEKLGVDEIVAKVDDEIVDEIVAKVDEEFDEAIQKSNIATLEEYIYGHDNVLNDVEISNKIILLKINTSTFQKEDVFMTDHARKQVLAKVVSKSLAELFKLLECLPTLKNVTAALTARFNGVYEELGEYILSVGATLYARKMVDRGQKTSDDQMIKISFPKRKITTANYTSYSKLQEKAAPAKQAAENANATNNNNSQAKDIVATIKSFEQYTNMLFRINHSFPTFDCVCYLNESISDDETVEKGPCTFQLTVGTSHSNNVTWDSYNLLDSLYNSSNQRKIKHFIVVLRSNIENFIYKNSFETNDLKLIEHLFEIENTKDKDNANEIISRAKKVIDEADKNRPDFKNVTSEANKTIFETKKFIADKALSKIIEKCVDQYCLLIN